MRLCVTVLLCLAIAAALLRCGLAEEMVCSSVTPTDDFVRALNTRYLCAAPAPPDVAREPPSCTCPLVMVTDDFAQALEFPYQCPWSGDSAQAGVEGGAADPSPSAAVLAVRPLAGVRGAGAMPLVAAQMQQLALGDGTTAARNRRGGVQLVAGGHRLELAFLPVRYPARSPRAFEEEEDDDESTRPSMDDLLQRITVSEPQAGFACVFAVGARFVAVAAAASADECAGAGLRGNGSSVIYVFNQSNDRFQTVPPLLTIPAQVLVRSAAAAAPGPTTARAAMPSSLAVQQLQLLDGPDLNGRVALDVLFSDGALYRALLPLPELPVGDFVPQPYDVSARVFPLGERVVRSSSSTCTVAALVWDTAATAATLRVSCAPPAAGCGAAPGHEPCALMAAVVQDRLQRVPVKQVAVVSDALVMVLLANGTVVRVSAEAGGRAELEPQLFMHAPFAELCAAGDRLCVLPLASHRVFCRSLNASVFVTVDLVALPKKGHVHSLACASSHVCAVDSRSGQFKCGAPRDPELLTPPLGSSPFRYDSPGGLAAARGLRGDGAAAACGLGESLAPAGPCGGFQCGHGGRCVVDNAGKPRCACPLALPFPPPQPERASASVLLQSYGEHCEGVRRAAPDTELGQATRVTEPPNDGVCVRNATTESSPAASASDRFGCAEYVTSSMRTRQLAESPRPPVAVAVLTRTSTAELAPRVAQPIHRELAERGTVDLLSCDRPRPFIYSTDLTCDGAGAPVEFAMPFVIVAAVAPAGNCTAAVTSPWGPAAVSIVAINGTSLLHLAGPTAGAPYGLVEPFLLADGPRTLADARSILEPRHAELLELDNGTLPVLLGSAWSSGTGTAVAREGAFLSRCVPAELLSGELGLWVGSTPDLSLVPQCKHAPADPESGFGPAISPDGIQLRVSNWTTATVSWCWTSADSTAVAYALAGMRVSAMGPLTDVVAMCGLVQAWGDQRSADTDEARKRGQAMLVLFSIGLKEPAYAQSGLYTTAVEAARSLAANKTGSVLKSVPHRCGTIRSGQVQYSMDIVEKFQTLKDKLVENSVTRAAVKDLVDHVTKIGTYVKAHNDASARSLNARIGGSGSELARLEVDFNHDREGLIMYTQEIPAALEKMNAALQKAIICGRLGEVALAWESVQSGRKAAKAVAKALLTIGTAVGAAMANPLLAPAAFTIACSAINESIAPVCAFGGHAKQLYELHASIGKMTVVMAAVARVQPLLVDSRLNFWEQVARAAALPLTNEADLKIYKNAMDNITEILGPAIATGYVCGLDGVQKSTTTVFTLFGSYAKFEHDLVSTARRMETLTEQMAADRESVTMLTAATATWERPAHSRVAVSELVELERTTVRDTHLATVAACTRLALDSQALCEYTRAELLTDTDCPLKIGSADEVVAEAKAVLAVSKDQSVNLVEGTIHVTTAEADMDEVRTNGTTELELRPFYPGWSTPKLVSALGNPGEKAVLDCAYVNMPGATMIVQFASYGTPRWTAAGDAEIDSTCHAPQSLPLMATACNGKSRCVVELTFERLAFNASGCKGVPFFYADAMCTNEPASAMSAALSLGYRVAMRAITVVVDGVVCAAGRGRMLSVDARLLPPFQTLHAPTKPGEAPYVRQWEFDSDSVATTTYAPKPSVQELTDGDFVLAGCLDTTSYHAIPAYCKLRISIQNGSCNPTIHTATAVRASIAFIARRPLPRAGEWVDFTEPSKRDPEAFVSPVNHANRCQAVWKKTQ